MIDGLQPYPAYRNPGVSWLEEVPEHWEVRQLKRTFRRVVGGSTPSSTEPSYWDWDIVWITPPDVSRTERLTTSLRRLTEEGLRACSTAMVPPGSIVVTTRAPVGNVAVAEVDLCTNQGCKALVPAHDVDSEFAFYVVRMLKPELQSLATGTTFTEISTSTLGAVQFQLPSLQEQAAIARFLDHADRRIRRYVAAKKALIALLNEQKQAIIHRTVTGGLDRHVRLKPSGVEWLGAVPEHWKVVRLGSVLRERGEKNDSGAVTSVLSLLRSRGVIPYEEKGHIGNKKSEDTSRYKIVRPNDIVVNCMNVIIGSVGLSPYTGCLSPVYYVLVRRSERDDPEYLNAVFQCRSFHQSLVKIGNGILAHRMRIPMELLKCELLPLPPSEEQARIVLALREMTRDCDDAINHAEREVDLVREYRTHLIADVVTGKLDVRDAAARLPDEVDEPVPLDDADALAESDESEGEADLDTAAGEAEP